MRPGVAKPRLDVVDLAPSRAAAPLPRGSLLPLLLCALGLGVTGTFACSGAGEPGDAAPSGPSAAATATAPLPAPTIGEVPAHPLVDTLAWRWIADGGPTRCAVALDREAVFLADEWDGTIRRLPKAGGPATVILDHQGEPLSLAVDEQHVFWTVQSVRRLRRAPKAGGAFGGLAAEALSPAHMALDGTDVVFTRAEATLQDDSIVLRVPKGGGAATVLAHAPAGWKSSAVAVDADHLYFAVLDPDSRKGLLQRVPKSGGQPVTLASEALFPGAIAVDGTNVYLLAQRPDGKGELLRVPKAGGEVVSLSKEAGAALALDATHVFYAGPGGVFRVAKTGGEPHLLAKVPVRALSMALDESALWACGEEGLYKLSWSPIPGPPQLLPTWKSSARRLAFDGRGRLVGGEFVGHVRAYDVTTGEQGPELGHEQHIRDLGMGADGTTLLIADHDGAVEGWNVVTGAREWRSAADKATSTEAFGVSPDGTLFLHRRGNDWARLASTKTGAEVRPFPARHESLTAVAIAPDNTFWLGAIKFLRSRKHPKPTKEPPFRMWDLTTGKETGVFKGQAEWILAIAITRDGERAVSVGEEGLLRVWDIATRSLIAALPAPGASSVALSRSGARALTSSLVEGLCLWDLPAQKRVACSPPRPRFEHAYYVTGDVAFSPGEDEAWWAGSNGFQRWKLPE